ncbi:MAG: tetratricopeptide repeat protein, partial [Planctomycetota bacterium]
MMAEKVNVKFVIILASVMVVIFTGVAVTAFFFATKSAAEYVTLGDAQADEGNWKEAARMYERAVGHDEARTNLEYLSKWKDALEQVPFDRAVLFEQQYVRKYRPLIRQVALTTAQNNRSNIAPIHDYLDTFREEMVFAPFSPEQHEMMVNETEEFLRFFEGSPPGEWSSIRRYRGIARARMMQFKADVTEEQADEALEDLDAAIEANPSDEASMMAVAQLIAVRAADAELQDREDIAERFRGELVERLDAFVEGNPTLIEPLIGKLRVSLFTELARMRDQNVVLDETLARELTAKFIPQLDAIEAQIRENGAANLTPQALLQFREMESRIDPEGRGRRASALASWGAEAQPENARMLIVLSNSQERSGDLEGATETLSRVLELPDPKMGLDGLFLFSFRQQAVAEQAKLAISRWTEASPEDQTARLAEAAEYVEALRAIVPEDAPVLQLATARLRVAEGELDEAKRILSAYNAATSERDAEALGIQARLAARAGNNGEAIEQFARVLEINANDINAMFGLAAVREDLQAWDEAKNIYERILRLLPDNERAASGLRRVRLIQGDLTPDDPVEAALIEAERLARGTALEPG